jgi:hypothetical protein
MRDPALWRRIEAMPLLGPEGLDLSEEVQSRLRWRGVKAHVVAQEYRKFLYLATVAPDTVAPSLPVDELWGLHVAAGPERWRAVRQALRTAPPQRPPLPAGRGEQYAARYPALCAAYRREFGTDPPPGVWHDPSKRYVVRFAPLVLIGLPIFTVSCFRALDGGAPGPSFAGMALGAALVVIPFALPRKLSRRGMNAEEVRRRMRMRWEPGEGGGGDGGGGDGGGGGGE